jgi:ferric-dicitrate binding protein FerR (iron transport regulator)
MSPLNRETFFMNYKEYEAEDFLLNPSFRNYCLGKNEQDIIFWEAWIAANPEKINEVTQAKELYFILNGNIGPGQFIKDETAFRNAVDEYTAAAVSEDYSSGANPVRKNFSIKRIWLLAGAAASVIGVIMILKWTAGRPPADPSRQYEIAQVSKPGERKSFQLPDGSKVMLNAGSSIKISKDFNTRVREIELEGEAFFDVVHNARKPFIIHTLSMDIKVLGTVFNVKAYATDKIAETSLLSGSVEVTIKNKTNQKVILHPNEKIMLPVDFADPGKRQPEAKPVEIKPENYTISGLTHNPVDSSLDEVSWIENQLAFNGNSFAEIAVLLERWYNVSISFEDEEVKKYRFTAIFDKKNIGQVLDALQLSRHFTYRIEDGNKIIIKQ